MTSPFTDMNVEHSVTQGAHIWMAGDYDQARQVLREFCSENGACFSIQPTDYIYSGGEEAGFRVTSINYPRFPRSYTEIMHQARDVADLLMKKLNQGSYTVETYGFDNASTSYYSRRKTG